MKQYFTFFIAFAIISSCTSKGSSNGFNVSEKDNKDLLAAETKMFEKIVAFDKDYWKNEVSDDYITINADGVMQTKAETLTDSASRKIPPGVTTKPFDRKARVYGDVAVITGRAQFFFQQKMVAEVFYTELWLKKNDHWLFNGWQGTLTKAAQEAVTPK